MTKAKARSCGVSTRRRLSGKGMEDMTDQELETVLAAADEGIALGKARPATVLETTLEKFGNFRK